MVRVRVVVALGLLAACATLVMSQEEGGGGIGQPPIPIASVVFKAGPTAGKKAGEVDQTVEWKNCTGAAGVQVYLWEVVGKNKNPVGTYGTASNKASDTWQGTATGLQTGLAVTLAEVFVRDANNANIASDSKTVNFTIP
jgi:hypothetical protein